MGLLYWKFIQITNGRKRNTGRKIKLTPLKSAALIHLNLTKFEIIKKPSVCEIVTLAKRSMNVNEFVVVDKEIAAGKPVFKGTRVTVQTLFDYLEHDSLLKFLKGFPTVTKQQAEAVIELAAQKLL